ncbi:acid proteinase [Xylariales sp. AK1849]|nr:acid proteinase [Xylariales sp. AK1849]
MKFSAVLGALLGAGIVAAAPFTEIRRQRAAARLDERRRRGFMIPDGDVETDVVSVNNGTSHVSYSTNWAGAVLIGTGYTSVTGSFVVPTPKPPTGGTASKKYSASAWVGIDGDTCTTSILQTGIDFYTQDGEVSFDAWYEWYPDYAYDFTNFAIAAGDTITMTVTATSKKTGTAVLKNTTTGKSVTHTFTAQTKALCQTNAEWIVEDFEEGSSLVPFCDFGTVNFKGATVNGDTGVTGATIIDLRQSGKVLTSCSASGESVSCSYV